MKKLTAILLCILVMVPALALAETLPYAKVYEPDTSFVLATTVAWEADASAGDVAAADVRPGTALVYVDKDLNVTTADGASLGALDEYVKATAGTMIPALYVQDEETAAALKAYLEASGLGDVFVVAACENAALVKDVADLNPVRGMVDFRGITEGDADTLLDIIKTTNGNHAKVALISEELATEDNVHYIQDRLVTVWVETASETKALLQQYTNGANGVLVKDYQAAIDQLAFFKDDAPSLLRPSNIIGHRGMPSVHVENTLLSAIGAYNAGADTIENDIYLSDDREIFILHDGNLGRLFNRPDVTAVEELTLKELKAIPFVSEGETGVQAKNNQPAAKSRYGYIDHLSSQRIPALREYIETFKGADVLHTTEIKSMNPAIVRALRNLVTELDAFDQIFTITFNKVILNEMYASWPELSIGALGMEGYGSEDSYLPAFAKYGEIIEAEGAEKALEMLYAELDRWNATYNPHLSFTYDLAVVGRHRGLTVWPWTYNTPEDFATGYLRGIYGLTTNFSWWATDFIRDIRAEDVTVKAGEALPAPKVVTQRREAVAIDGLELLTVEGSLESAGEALAIYRLKQDLVIDGTSYGSYYLYSNPFTVTVE